MDAILTVKHFLVQYMHSHSFLIISYTENKNNYQKDVYEHLGFQNGNHLEDDLTSGIFPVVVILNFLEKIDNEYNNADQLLPEQKHFMWNMMSICSARSRGFPLILVLNYIIIESSYLFNNEFK